MPWLKNYHTIHPRSAASATARAFLRVLRTATISAMRYMREWSFTREARRCSKLATLSARLFPPGCLVGPYVLQGLLGRTSWATTYAALTPDNVHVAVKVLDAAIAQPSDVLDEFEAALVSLTALSDRVLVRPIDAGEDDQTGAPFIVTALCRYPSLADLVGVEPLALADVLVVMRRLGRALDEARQAEQAHLALKPTNVFVGPPPEHEVLLTDFGMDVLRRAGARSGEAADTTWLAPEQMGPDTVGSARSDVYVASLLAIFALTGRPLPSARSTASTSPGERLAAHGLPLGPALGPELARGLAEDPLQRFESVTALADALSTCAGGSLASSSPARRAAEHHAKASGRMPRFQLPAEVAAARETEPRPIAKRTTKMGSFRLPDPKPKPSAPEEAASPPARAVTQLMPRFELPALRPPAPPPKTVDKTQRLAPFVGPHRDVSDAGNLTATARRRRLSLGGAQRIMELARSRPMFVLAVAALLALAGILVGVFALLRAAR